MSMLVLKAVGDQCVEWSFSPACVRTANMPVKLAHRLQFGSLHFPRKLRVWTLQS